MAIQNNFPEIRPALNLNFANTKSLDSRITFTRASTATYFDANGVMKTAPSGVARFDHDPATGESLGLLVEEQRTNLLLNSDALSTQTVVVANVEHTLSFYGAGQVVLSGAHSATVVGTGAFPTRTKLSFTPTAGSLTLTVTGNIEYAQLEAGAFPTSYIPTTSAQVTRSADVASMAGTNFSSWYNPTEGTLYAASHMYYPTASGTSSVSATIGMASNTSMEITITHQRSTDGRRVVTINNSTNQYSYAPAGNLYTDVQGAVAYKLNDSCGAIDGVVTATDNDCTIPGSMTTLWIGSVETGLSPINGHISSLTYYPKRLSDAVLQAITA